MNINAARNRLLPTLLCALLPFVAIGGEILPLAEPTRMDFALQDLHGKMHELDDYRGKVILVNFWASWCPSCIYEMPDLMQLSQDFADEPFEILAINAGEKKYKVRKFTAVTNLTLPVLLDTRNHAFNSWGVETLPTSFLVDANGAVRYRIRGNPGWANQETIAVMERLLAEKQDQPAEGRSQAE